MAASRHLEVAIGNLTLSLGVLLFSWADFILRKLPPSGGINPAEDSHWAGLGHMSILEPITEAQGNVMLSLASLESCAHSWSWG